MTDHGYVALVRDDRIVFAISLDESGALRGDEHLQPPPWRWALRPGDRVEFHATRAVPKGYRIERREVLDDGLFDRGRDGLVREVKFTALALATGGESTIVADPSVRWSRHERRYVLHPGFTSADLPPGEARARAAALLMAADEVERLSAREAGR